MSKARSETRPDLAFFSGGGNDSFGSLRASATANLLVTIGVHTHCIGGCILNVGRHGRSCPRNVP